MSTIIQKKKKKKTRNYSSKETIFIKLPTLVFLPKLPLLIKKHCQLTTCKTSFQSPKEKDEKNRTQTF